RRPKCDNPRSSRSQPMDWPKLKNSPAHPPDTRRRTAASLADTAAVSTRMNTRTGSRLSRTFSGASWRLGTAERQPVTLVCCPLRCRDLAEHVLLDEGGPSLGYRASSGGGFTIPLNQPREKLFARKRSSAIDSSDEERLQCRCVSVAALAEIMRTSGRSAAQPANSVWAPTAAVLPTTTAWRADSEPDTADHTAFSPRTNSCPVVAAAETAFKAEEWAGSCSPGSTNAACSS